jgi:single-strand DNA-binding protein
VTELRLPEVNRVLISGRLTRDPDRRYAQDGTPVTGFGIAFHRRWRGRDGRPAEQSGFVQVMTYQRLAEVCGQYLKRGNAVLVEGRLQMREWDGPDGGRRTRLEVRADAVHFLERAAAGSGEGAPGGPGRAPAESEELF